MIRFFTGFLMSMGAVGGLEIGTLSYPIATFISVVGIMIVFWGLKDGVQKHL